MERRGVAEVGLGDGSEVLSAALLDEVLVEEVEVDVVHGGADVGHGACEGGGGVGAGEAMGGDDLLGRDLVGVPGDAGGLEALGSGLGDDAKGDVVAAEVVDDGLCGEFHGCCGSGDRCVRGAWEGCPVARGAVQSWGTIYHVKRGCAHGGAEKSAAPRGNVARAGCRRC